MDAIAPGVAMAQAIGRWGNYFNQELFGRPTTVAVGARDRRRAPPGAVRAASTTFHPTFLYESLWCLAIVGRARLGRAPLPASCAGQTFALYVALYTFGGSSSS